MSKYIPTAVIGATGYTGLELVRLLSQHPKVEITALTSNQYAGKEFSEVYPAFVGDPSLKCEKLNVSDISKKIKVAFLCLPHHESMSVAHSLRSKGVCVIDLSADFRISDVSVYEKWYGKHTQKGLLREAVYGLPELHRNEIKKAKLVASAGCYPTSILLALAPLVKGRLIRTDDIVCDSKSGVSGAGRAAKVETLFCEVNENFKPYNVGSHRHAPEIEQELSLLAGRHVKIFFSPNLVPIDRGLLSTIYCKPLHQMTTAQLIKVFDRFYKKDSFVQVLPEGSFPQTKNVRGTNNCQISILYDKWTKRIVVLSAIDNLTKGASGQAVQSFNLMFGIPESTGLKKIALIP